MTSESLNKLLKALDAVKKDHTCGVCLEFCNNPVTLSKCFHIICSEHFEELKFCPTCKTDLEGCTTYFDSSLAVSVDATRELDKFFQNYVTKELSKDDEQHALQIPNTSVEIRKKETRKAKNIENANVKLTKITSTRSKPILKLTSVSLDNKPTTESDIGSKNVENTEKNTLEKDKKPLQLQLKNVGLNASEENTLLDSDGSSKQLKRTYKDTISSSKENDMKSTSETQITTVSIKFNKENEKRNSKGETLLHIACRLGKVERIVELLKLGANTNTKDNAGWTPLHELVQNGRLDLVKLLLQYNTLIDVPGPGNETPLHEAVRYNHTDIAIELVKHGADIYARNCKGETPCELASMHMKKKLFAAAEEIIQTQSLNITQISLLYSDMDFDDIKVFCMSTFDKVHNKLKILSKSHNNLAIETKFNKKVTHLIVDTEDGVCTSSIEVLQAIVNSLWILNTEWVTKSTKNKLETFESYEVIGVGNKYYNGPKNSRYNKYKQLPGVFDGCHFYLHNFNSKYEVTKSLVLTKANLSKLIIDAGGVVLNRVPNPEAIPDQEKLVPYHAKKDGKLVDCTNYIIFKDMYQPMYNMKHLKALPIGWLIECLEKYELCEPWIM